MKYWRQSDSVHIQAFIFSSGKLSPLEMIPGDRALQAFSLQPPFLRFPGTDPVLGKMWTAPVPLFSSGWSSRAKTPTSSHTGDSHGWLFLPSHPSLWKSAAPLAFYSLGWSQSLEGIGVSLHSSTPTGSHEKLSCGEVYRGYFSPG